MEQRCEIPNAEIGNDDDSYQTGATTIMSATPFLPTINILIF
jgi:hypothetical protein